MLFEFICVAGWIKDHVPLAVQYAYRDVGPLEDATDSDTVML